jgi:hypothetical protein
MHSSTWEDDMKKSTGNTARFAGLTIAAALVAASAFADSRPQVRTDRGASDRPIISRDVAGHANEAWRTGRGDVRVESVKRAGRGASHQMHGRVTKVQKWHGGHRVWVAGTPQPIFVPAAYWNRDRYRVGVTVRVGGHYNPGGWYDYDCWNCGGDVIRGVVVGVDSRRDVARVRTGRGGDVTVLLPRRSGRVRPGDHVEVYGDWTRRGVFAAFDVDVLRKKRR